MVLRRDGGDGHGVALLTPPSDGGGARGVPVRLYMDNAATSFPKPQAVLAAMVRYATELGASAGRGAYAEALETGKLIAAW